MNQMQLIYGSISLVDTLQKVQNYSMISKQKSQQQTLQPQKISQPNKKCDYKFRLLCNWQQTMSMQQFYFTNLESHQLIRQNNQQINMKKQQLKSLHQDLSKLKYIQHQAEQLYDKLNQIYQSRHFKNKIYFFQMMKKTTIKELNLLDNNMTLLRINFYFIEQTQINHTKECNFAYFHVLNILNCCCLLSYYKNHYATNLKSNLNFSLKKLMKKDVRAQLGDQIFYKISLFAVQVYKLSPQAVIAFIRTFLKQHRHPLQKFFGYYFNLSVFAANKSIIFQNQNISEYIQYSIPYKHRSMYKGNYNLQTVLFQIKLLERTLKDNLHSETVNSKFKE